MNEEYQAGDVREERRREYKCLASLLLDGEHFWCDLRVDANGRHGNWGHSSEDALAIWRGGPVDEPSSTGRGDAVRTEKEIRERLAEVVERRKSRVVWMNQDGEKLDYQFEEALRWVLGELEDA